MFLSKSTNTFWYLYYKASDGKTKRISTRCTTKAEAMIFLRAFQPEPAEKDKPVTLKGFVSEFLVYAETNYSKGTKGIYHAALDKFMDLFGDIQLKEIAPLHWDKYKTHRLKSDNSNHTKSASIVRAISPVTVNIELRTLRAALFVALRWRMIEANPFARQALCRVPEQKPLFFTKNDFQTLMEAIEEAWLKEIVVFAALTGMRRAEITNLRWTDIDLNRKMISIQCNPTFKTKNGKSRMMPLNDTVIYILLQKKEQQQGEYVFLLNGRTIIGNWMSCLLKRYIKVCGFANSGLHFHSLRHTFASWLVQDGVSLYEVQKLLGHADSKTTMIYSHLQPDQMHNTVNKINVHYT